MPAQSRMQKIHNVTQALEVLKSRKEEQIGGAPGSISDRDAFGAVSRHIVDGNLEHTLKLIWDVIST